MKLYTVVGSPNCRKVHAVINRLGLKPELAYLDFFAGDARQPAYMTMNPNGMVPTLVDGGLVLWESNAINQYLGDIAGDTPLWPRDPARRADIARWQFWEVAHFNKAFGTLAFETVAKPTYSLGPTDEALVAAATPHLVRFAGVLDAHMKGRTFACGDTVTLADYALIHLEGFKSALRFDWTAFPHLNAYFDRMRQDPSWARTAPSSPAAVGRRPKAA